jgi:hypothetical protein
MKFYVDYKMIADILEYTSKVSIRLTLANIYEVENRDYRPGNSYQTAGDREKDGKNGSFTRKH